MWLTSKSAPGIYSVQRQARENEKENFIIKYESDFDNNVQKLYDVIVNNDHDISNNIIQAVLQQTKNHKRKTEQFSLGLVQLLIQGIKVKVSYYGMKEWPTDHLVTEWETKMTNLRDTLQTISDVVKSRYLSQMKLDTKDLLLRYHGLGNKGLADKLYNFVTEKYDWRFWFVAVYDDMGALVSTICGSVAAHAFSMNMTRTPSSLAKAKNSPPSSRKTTPTKS